MIKKLSEFKLFNKKREKRIPLSMGLEITARCNLDCRQCYINLPVQDKKAETTELNVDEINIIADDAVKMGTLWCMISGGEPLLRKDFQEIYLLLKKKGLLVSVLTNGTLLNKSHFKLFKKYPPRCLEISMYGNTPETYEYVTQSKNTFKPFKKGLDMALNSGLNVIVKAMAMKSTLKELAAMQSLISKYENAAFVVDSLLISRIDGIESKNKTIAQERLEPRDVIAVQKTYSGYKDSCNVKPSVLNKFGGNLFLCNAGINSCWISSDGMVHLCSTLRDPELQYDLRKGGFVKFWNTKVPQILSMTSKKSSFIKNCLYCCDRIHCQWCPALSWTETGELDERVDYCCKIRDNR